MDTVNPLLQHLATDPASLSVESLRSLCREFPTFPLPAVVLLKYHLEALDQEEIAGLKLHLAMTGGDNKALYDILTEKGIDFASIYPPELHDDTVTTDNAIDTFFANYGTSNPVETALLERLIFNPVPDYAETLLREDGLSESTPQSGNLDECIDAFMRDHARDENSLPTQTVTPPTHRNAEPAPVTAQTPDESLLSESLAKIFIKQGRYERAYEIISNLSLNYPKKSIYFADQLRFLQKLIKIKQAQTGDKQ